MKNYLGYFDAIKHLDHDTQLTLLEKARYEAFVVQKLNGKSLVYRFYLVAVWLALTLAIVSVTLLFALPIWLGSAIPPLMVPLLLLADKRLQAPLLEKGLQAYLEQHPPGPNETLS